MIDDRRTAADAPGRATTEPATHPSSLAGARHADAPDAVIVGVPSVPPRTAATVAAEAMPRDAKARRVSPVRPQAAVRAAGVVPAATAVSPEPLAVASAAPTPSSLAAAPPTAAGGGRAAAPRAAPAVLAAASVVIVACLAATKAAVASASASAAASVRDRVPRSRGPADTDVLEAIVPGDDPSTFRTRLVRDTALVLFGAAAVVLAVVAVAPAHPSGSVLGATGVPGASAAAGALGGPGSSPLPTPSPTGRSPEVRSVSPGASPAPSPTVP
jgi:hypothetical protein